jgi:hypothetical protein
MTERERELARMLYATERAGNYAAFDSRPHEDCAPIYRLLATNLTRNEMNRAAIMAMLEKFDD